MRGTHMHDCMERTDAVRTMIDELRVCFSNIASSAELVTAKVQADGESNGKRYVQEIIKVAKSMDEKLSHFSQVCELAKEDCTTVGGKAKI